MHSSAATRETAEQLAATIATRVQVEDSGQSLYGQHLIDALFYKPVRAGHTDAIVDFMVRKRQRNAKVFFNTVRSALGEPAATGSEDTFSVSGHTPLDLPDATVEGLRHSVNIDMHFSSQSGLHAYLRISEPEAGRYAAGQVFELLKHRVLERCYQEGILVGDGTSWGFRNTRMDWYMHTLRIAIGAEHQQTMKRIAEIFAETLLDLKNNPETFMRDRSMVNFLPKVVSSNRDAINALLRQIPHDPDHFEDIDTLLRLHPEASRHSLLMMDGGKVTGLIVAYPKPGDEGSGSLYISKAVTDPSIRGRGGFRSMLERLEKGALRRHLSAIELNTSASRRNENIVRIYQHHGFSVDKDLLISWQSDGWPLAQVQMRKALPGSATEQEPYEGLTADFYERLRSAHSTVETMEVTVSSVLN